MLYCVLVSDYCVRGVSYTNKGIALALYPIVSLICNYPTIALDLKTTIQAGLETQDVSLFDIGFDHIIEVLCL